MNESDINQCRDILKSMLVQRGNINEYYKTKKKI